MCNDCPLSCRKSSVRTWSLFTLDWLLANAIKVTLES